MASDPAVSGKEAIRALEKLGFRLDRVEGSHHMLVKSGFPYTVVVPVHGSQALPKGMLPHATIAAASAATVCKICSAVLPPTMQ